MEKQGAKAGKEQGGLGAQGQAVALHQNGNQHRGPKHGEHVLQAQHQHPGRPQVQGVPNGRLSMVVSFSFIFSSPLPRENRKKNTGTSADTIGMTLQTLGLVQLPPT